MKQYCRAAPDAELTDPPEYPLHWIWLPNMSFRLRRAVARKKKPAVKTMNLMRKGKNLPKNKMVTKWKLLMKKANRMMSAKKYEEQKSDVN